MTTRIILSTETFEKCEFLFEFKEGENFNHPDLKFIGTGIHTLSISRINPPKFGGELKFEPVGAKRRSRPSGTQKSDKKGRFAKVSYRSCHMGDKDTKRSKRGYEK
jgi:hypothetical protein